MPIDSPEFRRIFGHWVTGVAVVAATAEDGSPCGLTANAVASLSLEPPLVLACIDRAADSHDCIRAAGFYSVNMLAADQERLARRFATWELPAKFEGVAYRPEVSGAPVLEDALAWVDCELWACYDGGDHSIFVGRVLAGDARDGEPLVFYRGGYAGRAP